MPVPTETVTATASPTAGGGGSGELAYASMRSGAPPQIYLSNIDGSDPHALTQQANGACQPAWSPDGNKLAFISPCPEKSDQYRQASLFILDLASGQIDPLPVFPGGSFEPAWSPDGSRIAFTSVVGGLPQIFLLDLNNLAATRLTPDALNTQAGQPAWSPDGKQIVYTVRRFNLLQIWTIGADGKQPTQLVRNGGGFSDYLPAWSPDGSLVLFSETSADASPPANLMRFTFASNKTEVVRAFIPVVDVAFSPDGQWVAYETIANKNQEIRIASLTSDIAQDLVDPSAIDFDPAWRP